MANVLKWHKPAHVASSVSLRNPLYVLQNEVEKVISGFDKFFSGQRYELGKFEGLKICPSVDIIDTKDHFKIECELPGLSENEVKVFMSEGSLTIKGEKSISKKEQEQNYLMREINYGYYERNIALPDNLDTDNAVASFKKGLLYIDIPKKEGAAENIRELKIEKK